MITIKLQHLWFLSIAVQSVFAQAPKDPTTDVCRRVGHQTAVIDRKLYIDGGWLYTDPMDLNPIPTMSEALIYGDLDVTYKGMPQLYANVSKNSSVPDVAGGILWPDDVNKIFWLYGGEYSNAPSTFELWGYDTILNQWNSSSAAQQATSTIQRASYGAGTTFDGLGFYYGGYLNERTSPQWNSPQIATTGLIRFDMTNNKLDNYTGPDTTGRAEGVMVSVPASAAGLLIYFGGVTFPYGNSTEVPMSMSEILVYDIGDGRWLTQTATGDIPPNRRKFCAGATWADDQSSYNIYLYGGMGFGENITGFDDVYILSLPTFEWIKWWEDIPIAYPKNSFTCDVIERGQMLIIGGNYSNDSTSCDVSIIGGQHNMNLGQLDATNAKWYAFLPNLTDYAVPADILSVAGGSSTGGAVNLAPANGWVSPNLKVYFGAKAQTTSRSATRYIAGPTISATPVPTPASSHGKPNIGAIAGGVVGGVLALVLIAVLAWYCLRARRRKGSESDPPAEPPSQSRPSMSTVNGLVTEPNFENKNAGAVVSTTSAGYQSPPHSAYATTPPPLQPGYQIVYLHPGQSPPQQSDNPLYQNLMMQQPQPYGFPHYAPGNTSPPAAMYPQQHQYHQQTYFPPPESNRTTSPQTSNTAHEMPIASTPGIHHVAYRPTPQRVDVMDALPAQSRDHSRSDWHSRSTSG